VCENNNRCAGCGERLFERKLNAAYYNGKIWNAPGFCGFRQKCAGPPH